MTIFMILTISIKEFFKFNKGENKPYDGKNNNIALYYNGKEAYEKTS